MTRMAVLLAAVAVLAGAAPAHAQTTITMSGDQVVQVTSSAVPAAMAADTLTTAISDQLATMPSR